MGGHHLSSEGGTYSTWSLATSGSGPLETRILHSPGRTPDVRSVTEGRGRPPPRASVHDPNSTLRPDPKVRDSGVVVRCRGRDAGEWDQVRRGEQSESARRTCVSDTESRPAAEKVRETVSEVGRHVDGPETTSKTGVSVTGGRRTRTDSGRKVTTLVLFPAGGSRSCLEGRVPRLLYTLGAVSTKWRPSTMEGPPTVDGSRAPTL